MLSHFPAPFLTGRENALFRSNSCHAPQAICPHRRRAEAKQRLLQERELTDEPEQTQERDTTMNMIKNLMAAFAKDESGAVTIDWVVLTVAVVGIASAAGLAVSNKIVAATTGLTL